MKSHNFIYPFSMSIGFFIAGLITKFNQYDAVVIVSCALVGFICKTIEEK